MKSTGVQIPEALKENQHIYEQYFDLGFVVNLLENVYPILNEVYFRAKFIGFDELPERNQPEHPLIFASNHSGMAFPWDAMIFGAGYIVKSGFREHIRALVAPMLTQTRLMNPYLMAKFWERMGGVPATFRNFETMMFYPHSHVLIYPEGVPGIGKGFNRKYQLQRLATSFVRMSLKYKTDIVSFATVNAEYINPHSYSFDWINRLSQKVGIPFLPIGWLVLLIPFQPWIFYFGLPARLTYVMGQRMKPYEWTDKSYEELSEPEIAALRDEVHRRMQAELTAAVEKYGRRPYRWKQLFKRMWKHRKYFPFYLPFCWPLMFEEFHRLHRKHPGQPIKIKYNLWSFFRMMLMNPITVCYFIPIVGWIPLLIRGYSRNQ